MSQKYDEYLEKHRQAVKKAYQWIAAYIPELTDVERLEILSSMICQRIRQMSTRLMTTISMGSKPQQSSRRLTGHGLYISTETPIIGSIGS